MHKLAFKTFIWPINPAKFRMKYLREPMFEKDQLGNDVYIGLADAKCTVTGSGVFTGELAYDAFYELEELVKESTSGLLTLPDGSRIPVYFTELTMDQDPRAQYVGYHFTFQQADDSGALPA